VNEPTWLKRLGSFAKPFFSEKLQKRVHFHGDDYTGLGEHVPLSMLPHAMGGSLCWEEAVDHELMGRVREGEEFHQRWRCVSFK